MHINNHQNLILYRNESDMLAIACESMFSLYVSSSASLFVAVLVNAIDSDSDENCASC